MLRLQLIALCFAGLGASACGDRCQDACGIRNDCAVDAEPVQCADVCSFERTQAEASGCAEPYDAWLDCRTGLDDLCAATGEECLLPQGEHEACVAAFCDDNAAHEACAAP